MVYYVVYKASKNYTNRSLIPLRLRTIGCKQINKTFWEFDKEKMHEVLKVLRKNQPIVLKRIKEIKKRTIAEGRIQDLGSLVVVTFRVPKDEKERVRNFVKKAPCIRLCKRVYAFYQRYSRFDSENKLIDAQRLAVLIKKHGGEVKLLPKIVVLDESSVERLLDETRRKVEKEIFDIRQKCLRLYYKCVNNECKQRQVSESLRKIKRQFLWLRRKTSYYKKWIKLDLSKDLMTAYRALNKVRQTVIRINLET